MTDNVLSLFIHESLLIQLLAKEFLRAVQTKMFLPFPVILRHLHGEIFLLNEIAEPKKIH